MQETENSKFKQTNQGHIKSSERNVEALSPHLHFRVQSITRQLETNLIIALDKNKIVQSDTKTIKDYVERI